MPLYTDHGSSDLSREGKTSWLRVGVLAGVPGTEWKRLMCASDGWQALGARSQEIPRKGKEFNFLTWCLSAASWLLLLPVSLAVFFHILLIPLLKRKQRAPRLHVVKLMKVSSCWVESLQRNVMTQCPRCSWRGLWDHSVAVAGDSNTKNMWLPVPGPS